MTEAAKQEKTPTPKAPGWLHRHWIIIAVLSVVLSFAASFNIYAYYSSEKIIADKNDQISKDQETIKKLKEEAARKLAAKKKAEAEAKKKAEEEAKAKAAAEAAAKAAAASTVPTAAESKACNSATSHINPSATDVVVNKKHCMQPLNFVPNLTTIYGATISVAAADSFAGMMNAMQIAGLPTAVTSSYRSYDSQVATYNYWVRMNGSQASADTVSARPGYSEHQTGLAVDLAVGSCSLECFAGTAQHAWLVAHGAEYGFIQRYKPGFEAITGYSAEAWHWRYVGVAVATDMKARGIHTLEQYFGMTGGGY